MNDETNYQCHHCNKRFKYERFFIRHTCKLMQRQDLFQTPTGQAARGYYEKWMKLQGRRVPEHKSFLRSTYFTSFIKFAEFVKELKLPSVDIFIKMMVQEQYTPTMWRMNEVYVKYIEHLDYNTLPLDQAQITVKTIDRIADAAECKPNEIFDIITASEVAELIRQRKLSPWILLNSKKFFEFLHKTKKESAPQFSLLASLLRTSYWKTKFNKDLKSVNQMKEIISGLGL